MRKGIFDLKNSTFVLGLFLFMVTLTSCNQQDIKFYKANVVFNEFKMTSEYHDEIEGYQQAFDQRIQGFTTQLDSLKRDFKVETDEKRKKLLYYKISDFQQSLDKELEKGELVLQQKVKTGDEEIWKRLQKYLSDYCKEKNVHLLVDVGSVVATPYYDEDHDITEECSKYINKRYNEVLTE